MASLSQRINEYWLVPDNNVGSGELFTVMAEPSTRGTMGNDPRGDSTGDSRQANL